MSAATGENARVGWCAFARSTTVLSGEPAKSNALNLPIAQRDALARVRGTVPLIRASQLALAIPLLAVHGWSRPRPTSPEPVLSTQPTAPWPTSRGLECY